MWRLSEDDMRTILTDYMEKGFLENIEDMFRDDNSLFSYLGDMIADERGRVRIGTVALVEGLLEDYRGLIEKQIPEMAKALASENPTVRADTIYLFGVIESPAALNYMRPLLDDPSADVRQIARETMAELEE